MMAVLHQPTGTLGAEEDADHEDEGRDEGRAELQTPGDGASVFDDDVGAEAKEDANDDPELPEHDEGAADAGWGHFSRVDRHGSILCADADAHDKASGEETLPGFGKARADGGGCEAGCGEEDFSSSAEVVVEGIDNESTAEETHSISMK